MSCIAFRSLIVVSHRPWFPRCFYSVAWYKQVVARRHAVGYGIREDMPSLKQYDAELDDKARITIQGSKFRKFVVTHDKNGNIILQPRGARMWRPLAVISVRTLKMMDSAMANFRRGRVSSAIDLSAATPAIAQPIVSLRRASADRR